AALAESQQNRQKSADPDSGRKSRLAGWFHAILHCFRTEPALRQRQSFQGYSKRKSSRRRKVISHWFQSVEVNMRAVVDKIRAVRGRLDVRSAESIPARSRRDDLFAAGNFTPALAAGIDFAPELRDNFSNPKKGGCLDCVSYADYRRDHGAGRLLRSGGFVRDDDAFRGIQREPLARHCADSDRLDVAQRAAELKAVKEQVYEPRNYG